MAQKIIAKGYIPVDKTPGMRDALIKVLTNFTNFENSLKMIDRNIDRNSVLNTFNNYKSMAKIMQTAMSFNDNGAALDKYVTEMKNLLSSIATLETIINMKTQGSQDIKVRFKTKLSQQSDFGIVTIPATVSSKEGGIGNNLGQFYKNLFQTFIQVTNYGANTEDMFKNARTVEVQRKMVKNLTVDTSDKEREKNKQIRNVDLAAQNLRQIINEKLTEEQVVPKLKNLNNSKRISVLEDSQEYVIDEVYRLDSAYLNFKQKTIDFSQDNIAYNNIDNFIKLLEEKLLQYIEQVKTLIQSQKESKKQIAIKEKLLTYYKSYISDIISQKPRLFQANRGNTLEYAAAIVYNDLNLIGTNWDSPLRGIEDSQRGTSLKAFLAHIPSIKSLIKYSGKKGEIDGTIQTALNTGQYPIKYTLAVKDEDLESALSSESGRLELAGIIAPDVQQMIKKKKKKINIPRKI